MFITDGDPNEIVRKDQVTYDPGNPNVAANEYELKVPLADGEVESRAARREGPGGPERQRDEGAGLAHPHRRGRQRAQQLRRR